MSRHGKTIARRRRLIGGKRANLQVLNGRTNNIISTGQYLDCFTPAFDRRRLVTEGEFHVICGDRRVHRPRNPRIRPSQAGEELIWFAGAWP